MYVCLCNGLTDRQVRGVARTAGCSVGSVHRSLGVRPQCGKCLPMMRDICRELHRELTCAGADEGLAALPSPA